MAKLYGETGDLLLSCVATHRYASISKGNQDQSVAKKKRPNVQFQSIWLASKFTDGIGTNRVPILEVWLMTKRMTACNGRSNVSMTQCWGSQFKNNAEKRFRFLKRAAQPWRWRGRSSSTSTSVGEETGILEICCLSDSIHSKVRCSPIQNAIQNEGGLSVVVVLDKKKLKIQKSS